MALLGLVGVAAAVIVVRAATGSPLPFLDTNRPSQPYRWVSPPSGVDHRNQPPSGGETSIQLTNGKSGPASLSTDDGQVTVSFAPGTFIAPPRETSVRIRITPLNPQPASPADIVLDGNAYVIDATYMPSGAGPAALQLPIVVALRCAGRPKDAIYRIDGKAWTPIGGTLRQQLLTVEARTTQLGTFVAAYRLAAAGPRGFNAVPFLLGGLAVIGVLLIAGVRVPAVRRRLRSRWPHRGPDEWIK